MEETNELLFFVNGKKIIEKNPDPEWTLLFYLREKLHLCGTKLGCGEGGCGACTVMISKYNSELQNVIHLAVNACLTPLCIVHGVAITTVEGIGSTKTKLHPAQERLAKAHGSQCGFCTPGIVMSMYTLLRNMANPSLHDLEIAFQGNLCRCTGYRSIIEGYKTFTIDCEGINPTSTNSCSLKENCCKFSTNRIQNQLFDANKFVPYDPSQEPIFPPYLIINHEAYNKQYLVFKGLNMIWYRPVCLQQLIQLKMLYPKAKIVFGNTELGIEMKTTIYPIIICPNQINELTLVAVKDFGLLIGAGVTLDRLELELNRMIKSLPENKTRIFGEIVKILYWFASKQIRNCATVGGNLMNSSPISDLNPIWLAINAELKYIDSNGFEKVICVDDQFFTGYRKNKINECNGLLISIKIPFSDRNEYYFAYKQARRKDDDIAIVNTCIYLQFGNDTQNIVNSRIAYGGMAATTVLAEKTSKFLKGKNWNEIILDEIYEKLLDDLQLPSNAPGGMVEYRLILALSLFFKFFLYFNSVLKNSDNQLIENERVFALTKSSQYFTMSSKLNDPIGQPIVHSSAFKQASGEAVYCDDVPKFSNELYLALVLSKKAHAKIIKIDAVEALNVDGVVKFFSADDLPEKRNLFGVIDHEDREIFARNEVYCHGQIVGAIVAIEKSIAKKAAALVKIEYDDLPFVLTIDEAIKNASYFPGYPVTLIKGDPDWAFKQLCDHVIENQYRIGGQEHFYLETQCTIAVPHLEDDEMEIFSATQDPSETSKLIAHMLDVPINRITTRVKRMGGAFGGKETAAFVVSLPVSLAAYKLKQPVRCMLDRDEDMLITAGRNPFLFNYKVGFSLDGKIHAIDVQIYCNSGFCLDLSPAVLNRAMFHIQNAYKIENIRLNGYLCKTNLPSNTAFRGFGMPQSIFAAECMIRQVAEYIDKNVIDVMKLNFCTDNMKMHYGQHLDHCTLEKCFNECLDLSDYYKQHREIEIFNKNNKWKKRGISLVPLIFGVGFDAPFMNQAGALVHIYTDGSVLISHGGTEMGQGLHTKMIQVASRVLEIPIDRIHIAETATDKVPNTLPTAASSSSDLNGMAIIDACEKLMERLKPYKEKNPDGNWDKWVELAYFDRVSLSCTGFYKTPDIIGYNWETGEGFLYNYFSFGTGCSQVEIDCLTGDHRILRTDLVMDVGQSLNPAIDVGQIEGAFIQGCGLYTQEQLMYLPNGALLTKGPGNYKIPAFANIPLEFNVSILQNVSNLRAIYSSKAVGEPPFGLSVSVLFAIREAIKAARKENKNKSDSFVLNSPATVERIRLACLDNISNKVFKDIKKKEFKGYWNVTVE